MDESTMPQRARRRNLLEISDQPELWIFSNLLAEKWINEGDLTKKIFERQVTMPISLPSGTAIIKFESDGTQGEIISVSVAHLAEIYLFQLIDPSAISEFQQKVLAYIDRLYIDTFDFFSYLYPYYQPKMKEFGILEKIGETIVKDLANYGVKSRILQRIADPVQGYEVPQYWRVNKHLKVLGNENRQDRELIENLRSAICDRLAKHAVIENLRCSVIALKHYADLLDSMTSEAKIVYSDEYLGLADGLYELGEYQDAAVFYSKCLSQATFEDEADEDRLNILAALKSSIEHLEPQEFLEYALFAAKVAQSHEED
jgi:hypothetical protein